MYSDTYTKKQEAKNAKHEKKYAKKEAKAENKFVKSETKQAAHAREKAASHGRKKAEKFLNRDVEGLAPEKRKAMQYEAERQINRGQQGLQRQLLGNQAQQGIMGKSGVGYAQQRDLARGAQEAKGQVQRDLTNLNSDLALKKLAAMFNIEQGEAAQSQLDRQMAQDAYRLKQEKAKQRAYEQSRYRSFARV